MKNAPPISRKSEGFHFGQSLEAVRKTITKRTTMAALRRLVACWLEAGFCPLRSPHRSRSFLSPSTNHAIASFQIEPCSLRGRFHMEWPPSHGGHTFKPHSASTQNQRARRVYAVVTRPQQDSHHGEDLCSSRSLFDASLRRCARTNVRAHTHRDTSAQLSKFGPLFRCCHWQVHDRSH